MIRQSTFIPAWWLPGCHAQTIWPGIFRRKINLNVKKERLELPDNDFIDLVWSDTDNPGPLIIILHGLEGSIDSHYSKGMMKALINRNMKVVFMHFRGCSGVPNRQLRSYHSGETGDLRYLVKMLKKRFPGEKIAAIGYSLGGNVLLKYLGEYRNNTFLHSAVAVSVPFDLSDCARKLETGFSRIYQYYLIKKLHGQTWLKFRKRNDTPFDLDNLKHWNTFYQFDNYVTAPLHGFKDSDEYYSLNSSKQFLKSIEIPTLIIQAVDDPFINRKVIPGESELSEKIILELSENGGHVGFIQGKSPLKTCYWLEQRIPDYLEHSINGNK